MNESKLQGPEVLYSMHEERAEKLQKKIDRIEKDIVKKENLLLPKEDEYFSLMEEVKLLLDRMEGNPDQKQKDKDFKKASRLRDRIIVVAKAIKAMKINIKAFRELQDRLANQVMSDKASDYATDKIALSGPRAEKPN